MVRALKDRAPGLLCCVRHNVLVGLHARTTRMLDDFRSVARDQHLVAAILSPYWMVQVKGGAGRRLSRW
jgi:hypothetical protein